MMILPTGKKTTFHSSLAHQKGVSFFEVLVAVVIMTTGLIAIYRSFFLTVDYLQYLSTRTQAQHLLQTKIGTIEQQFKLLKDFDIGNMVEEVEVDGKKVFFQYDIQLRPVEALLSVFELEVALIWEHRGRNNRISQTIFFSGLTSVE